MNKAKSPETGSFIRQILKSLAISAVFSAAAIVLGALGAYSAGDPGSVVGAVGVAVSLVSALFCGAAAARITDRGAFAGLCAGVSFMLILMLLSFIPLGTVPMRSGAMRALLYPSLAAVGVLGGVIGTQRKAKKPKHRRKRQK